MADGVIRLNKRHVGKAAGVLTAAFSDDAFFAHLFPDPAVREKAMPVVYGVMANLFISKGWGTAPSEAVEGVLIARPPEALLGFSSFFRALAMAKILRFAPLLKTIRRARPYGQIWAKVERYFKRYKGFVWIDMIAVDPEYQGKGFMSRMLRPVLEDVKARGSFCLLDTENAANVPIYEHFGFEVVEKGVVEEMGIEYWVMAYDPCGVLGKV